MEDELVQLMLIGAMENVEQIDVDIESAVTHSMI